MLAGTRMKSRFLLRVVCGCAEREDRDLRIPVAQYPYTRRPPGSGLSRRAMALLRAAADPELQPASATAAGFSARCFRTASAMSRDAPQELRAGIFACSKRAVAQD